MGRIGNPMKAPLKSLRNFIQPLQNNNILIFKSNEVQ